MLYQAECSSTHFWGSDLEILGLEVTTMLKCRKSYQRRILYPQIMSQKWNEFVCTRQNVQVPTFEVVTLEILGLEVTTMLKCRKSYQRRILYPQIMSQKWNEFVVPGRMFKYPLFEVVTLKSLVWRSRLCWNVEKVIRDESSTLRSCHRSEMNLLYQAECSSTHFWGSDLEIPWFGGHDYVEIVSMSSNMTWR